MNAAAGTPQSNQNSGTPAAPVMAGQSASGGAAGVPRHAFFGKTVATAFAAGVLGLVLMPRLPPVAVLMALLAAGSGLWWCLPRARWTGALLCGVAVAGLHAGYALSVQIPPGEPVDVRLRGEVVELPDHQSRRTAFVFRVDPGPSQPGEFRGRLLRLSWYDGFDGSPSGRDRLRAGQEWEFDLRLRAPGGLRNPGGQDAEKHAMARRLAATGYVRSPETAVAHGPPTGLQAWRERMAGRIDSGGPQGPARFVRALALGDTRGLGDEDWRVLRANGLTHLIAISGFHVGLVAGLFALLGTALWRLLPGLGRVLPRQAGAAVLALAGAIGYAAVAGFALPTVRTVLMIAVVAGVRLLRRRGSGFDSLALAALAVLVVDPLSVLGAGFWLSFFGVAWLLWCLPEAGRRPLHDLLAAQGVASLGLLPLTVVLFNQASLAGPLSNLVAIPWWSLVVVPLALVGAALEALVEGWGGWAWDLAGWCFARTWPLFEYVAGSPLALWWLPEPGVLAVPLAMAGAFWLLLPRGLPGRWLALLLWLPLLWPDQRLPAHGGAEVVVLDVGQGTAVVVRTARHALLYDAGPAVPDGFDAGERVVVPALRALGVRRLDRVVVSHADHDHAGGVDAVLAELLVGTVEAPDGSGVALDRPCIAGQAWEWDGVRFHYLHPTPHFPYLGNDAGCVLRVSTAHGAMLLPGDVGHVVEREMVRRASAAPGAEVTADVVLVGHHGSRGSSDPAFVEATGARHALVSSGFGNRFGHPTAEVVDRWAARGATVVSTAGSGALTVRLEPGGPRVETRRSTHPRLWDARRRAIGAPEDGNAALSYRAD